MFNSKKTPDTANTNINTANINTIIGEGCLIKGDISSKNSIKIDGTIQGNVTIEGSVIIGEKGSIQGDIRCSELVVFGQLDGNITSRQLQLKKTAKIHGNIEAQSFQVEPGAVYQGTVSMQTNAKPEIAPATSTSAKA